VDERLPKDIYRMNDSTMSPELVLEQFPRRYLAWTAIPFVICIVVLSVFMFQFFLIIVIGMGTFLLVLLSIMGRASSKRITLAMNLEDRTFTAAGTHLVHNFHGCFTGTVKLETIVAFSIRSTTDLTAEYQVTTYFAYMVLRDGSFPLFCGKRDLIQSILDVLNGWLKSSR
jgi:hypothetical protein